MVPFRVRYGLSDGRRSIGPVDASAVHCGRRASRMPPSRIGDIFQSAPTRHGRIGIGAHSRKSRARARSPLLTFRCLIPRVSS